jgi:hypothetical protein
MNLRRFLAASLLFAGVLSSSALLAEENVEAKPYAYGMRLDIAKVIRIDEPQPLRCELVRARMTYLNSKGEREAITFLKHAEVCQQSG